MAFNGFISYSHAADGRLAPAVHRGLHRLGKPWHRRRALWIFRDQTGLSVTPALWSSIQTALDGSEYFVLLASPEAARSPWVNREIEHWVATKSAGQILPVLTDGEWRWDPEHGDFTADSTAVPAALRGVFAEEPLYLDLRWARDDRHLSLAHSRFRDAIAQLAAPMHGVSKDDLESEDVRQHRRARQLSLTAAAVLVVLTLVASLTGVLAVHNAGRVTSALTEARRQEQAASEQRSQAAESAAEALRQQRNARTEQQRARDAAAETKQQEKLAHRQKVLAEDAAAEATRQQTKAQDQQRVAKRAVDLARQQEALAAEQAALARQAGKETVRQRTIAAHQQSLAQQAVEETQQQKRIAAQQLRWAQEATAEARRQQSAAQQAAKDATEKARLQKGIADQQQRIANGRRLINQAKAMIDTDPATALKLGIAAQQVQPDAEARRELAGMVTSTRYAGTLGDVVGVATSPTGIMATVDTDYTTSLWNVADPAHPVRLARLDDNIAVGQPVFSPDGRTLVVIEMPWNYTPVLWDVANPTKPVRLGALPDDVDALSVAFNPDGRTLVSTDATTSYLTFWDLADRRRPQRIPRPAGGVIRGFEVVFSPNGRTMVTTNGRATIWDVKDPANPIEVGEVEGDWAGIAFNPKTPVLATRNRDGTLTLWDLSNGRTPSWRGRLQGLSGVMAFSADGTTLASGDNQGRTQLWDVSDPEEPLQIASLTDPGGSADAVTFGPDGRTVVTLGASAEATLWSVAARGAPKLLGKVDRTVSETVAVALTRDGRALTAVQGDGSVVIWDVTNPAGPVRRFGLPAGTVRADPTEYLSTAAVSADGTLIAGAGDFGSVTLTDVADPRRPRRLATPPLDDVAQAPAFSPDGRTLAVGAAAHLVLWDLTDRRRGPTYLSAKGTSAGITAIAWSPDSRTVAVATDRTVTTWDVTNRSAPVPLAVMKGHGDRVVAMVFSPNGRTLATGSRDRRVMLWNVADRARPRKLAILTGHRSWVSSLAFAPDSRTLAAGGKDARALVWDIEDPTKPVLLATLAHSSLGTDSVMFHPDGHTLAAANDYVDSAPTTFWSYTDLNTLRADPAAYACAITDRGLTAAEWAGYLPGVPYQPTCPR